MKLFVNSERDVDWALHLYTEKLMMPYLYSARHNNYAQYGLYYLRSLEHLPKHDFTKLEILTLEMMTWTVKYCIMCDVIYCRVIMIYEYS